MRGRSFYRDVVQAQHFQTFGHQMEPDGRWRFWIVEDRYEEVGDNTTSIYLREVVQDGMRSETVSETRLFEKAGRAQLWFSGDQVTESIVMVFESYWDCAIRSHLRIVQYASV